MAPAFLALEARVIPLPTLVRFVLLHIVNGVDGIGLGVEFLRVIEFQEFLSGE